MLIRERLEQYAFSDAERITADYILKVGLSISPMTTREIAAASHTVSSTLVRIAHKLGFRGWNELKAAFLQEEEYLQTHFSQIDANFPFQRGDSFLAIAGKIAALKKETVDDTLSLITQKDLQTAVQLLRHASSISLFAVSNNLLNAQEFQHNMNRIRRPVSICSIQGESIFSAYLMEPPACAIVISYSGETRYLLGCVRVLKEHHIPVIAVTNIGDSSLSRAADCVLRLTTREKLYSKIATFSVDCSVSYLLDVLYSCIFALDYDSNKALRIKSSQEVETARTSTLSILQEKRGTPSA